MGRAARWLEAPADPAAVERLQAALGIGALTARVLAARGYIEPEAARHFLCPSLDDLHDPYLLLGMRTAVDRLRRAIGGGEKMLLYGDYDVDGATSVVILSKAIELAGGRAEHHVPHRLNEGYGIRTEVIEQAAARGVGLLVSLDTGIRDTDAVCKARSLGLDVIITDHHLPDSGLPPALAVLNPKQNGCPYPEKNLCAAGVAFKLSQALFGTLGWGGDKVRRMTESFLKLAAIGTVADVVPLTGENRIIVKHGLQGLRSVRNPGLRALLEVAGIETGQAPSAEEVAFRIAPRMNAAGRMADAQQIIDLLLTEDEEHARGIAARMHDLNRERQEAETGIVREILDACLRVPVTDRDAALVFSGQGWHRGVVGIVASRLVERFHRPVIVLGEEDGIAQGSGRSIPAFHLLEALESMPELFTRFGGHRQACGLALESSRVEEFRGRLNGYAAARLTEEDFAPEITLDAEIRMQEISESVVNEVFALAPFGFGNPAPVFAICGAEVAGTPCVIKDRHLRLNLRQNGRLMTVMAWNFAGRADELSAGAPIDAALVFEEDDYSRNRGFPGWSAVLKDVRRS